MLRATYRRSLICAAVCATGLLIAGCANPPPIVGGETPFSLGGNSQVKGFAPTATAFTAAAEKGKHPAEAHPAAPADAGAAPVAGGLEISTVGNELKFDRPSMSAKGGGKITVTLHNKGSSPSLEHNWVLAKAGSVDAVAAAGLSAGPGNAWVAPKDPNIVAHTKLVKGRAADSVTFDAPPAGKYSFLCSFPGHSGSMHGEFAVE